MSRIFASHRRETPLRYMVKHVDAEGVFILEGRTERHRLKTDNEKDIQSRRGSGLSQAHHSHANGKPAWHPCTFALLVSFPTARSSIFCVLVFVRSSPISLIWQRNGLVDWRVGFYLLLCLYYHDAPLVRVTRQGLLPACWAEQRGRAGCFVPTRRSGTRLQEEVNTATE